MEKKLFSNIPLVAGLFFAVILVILGVVLATRQKPEESLEKPSATLGAENTKTEVQLFIEFLKTDPSFPRGEEPVVSRITNVNKLKVFPLYENARDGDYLVQYLNANKAYIYRYDTREVIAETTSN